MRYAGAGHSDSVVGHEQHVVATKSVGDARALVFVKCAPTIIIIICDLAVKSAGILVGIFEPPIFDHAQSKWVGWMAMHHANGIRPCSVDCIVNMKALGSTNPSPLIRAPVLSTIISVLAVTSDR